MREPDFTPHPKDAELRVLSEADLVARFARARDAGDVALKRAVWRRLAIRSLDRVRQRVRAHTFGTSGGLPAHHHDDAVQEAWLRIIAMGEDFRGSTVGEFRVAIKTCVWNACMDFGRAQLATERRSAGSLDAPWKDGGGDTSPWDAALHADYGRREADRRDKEAAEVRLQRDRELIAWGIAQVENPGYRAVLEHTYLDPLPAEELARRLDLSVDNLYQRRRRGKLRLEEILRDTDR